MSYSSPFHFNYPTNQNNVFFILSSGVLFILQIKYVTSMNHMYTFKIIKDRKKHLKTENYKKIKS